jgi:hypothetical protein
LPAHQPERAREVLRHDAELVRVRDGHLFLVTSPDESARIVGRLLGRPDED